MIPFLDVSWQNGFPLLLEIIRLPGFYYAPVFDGLPVPRIEITINSALPTNKQLDLSVSRNARSLCVMRSLGNRLMPLSPIFREYELSIYDINDCSGAVM